MPRSHFLFVAALLSAPAIAWADPTTEEIAQKLLTTTVTVRSQRSEVPTAQVAQADKPNPQAQQQLADNKVQALLANDGVTVSSGVSVRRGYVVTFNHPDAANEPEQVRYRVTLPDGEQTKAAIRVVDQYSGLSLLELDDRTLPALEPCEACPAVGATILTAAASGIEKPLVSQGIISGLDRTLAGNDLPPLLQCDILSTENSAGAGVVDRSGKLVGVIVASPQVGQRGGWVYAVPALHVKRLFDANTSGKIAVIKRQRPMAGLSLKQGPGEGTIEVISVVEGGPADKAGIKVGDILLEAQGRKLRNAFQAFDLITNRMPGDRMNFVVQQGEQKKSVDVTLAGVPAAKANPQPYGYNVQVPAGQADPQQAYVGPQVNIRNVGPNKYEIRSRFNPLDVGGGGGNANPSPQNPVAQNPSGGNAPGGTAGGGQNPTIANPSAANPNGPAAPNEQAPRRAPDEVTLLRLQVEAFGRVIVKLQDEIRRRQATEMQNEKTVQSLRTEVDELRRELDAKRDTKGPAATPVAPAKPAGK